MTILTATTFFQRLKGLLGRSSFPPDTLLLFPNSGSVHTFFMRFPIDILFLDADYKILRIRRNVPPFRLCLAPRGTRHVAEAASGWLPPDSTLIGFKIAQVF